MAIYGLMVASASKHYGYIVWIFDDRNWNQIWARGSIGNIQFNLNMLYHFIEQRILK